MEVVARSNPGRTPENSVHRMKVVERGNSGNPPEHIVYIGNALRTEEHKGILDERGRVNLFQKL